jgi:N4-gp56 family major capsid protein
MANTSVASELVAKKFLSDFFREYIRGNRFSRYTGTGVNNVVCIKEGRKQIEVPLVTRLQGNGVAGSSTLRGNGEAIGNYGLTLTPTYYRNAVEFDKEEIEKPAIDLMRAARPLLLDWAMELTRDHIIDAMMAMNASGTYVAINDASAANANAWSVANSDRVLYGAVESNYSGVFATDLAKCDTSADIISPAIISLAKRMAKLADPHIRPIKTSEDEEWYVMFMDPYVFAQLKRNSVMLAANQDARVRGISNPIFKDGDLMWDGVIIREVPEIATAVDYVDGTNTTLNLLTGGASSVRTAPSFLCGAQALSFGLGQRPNVVVDRDYDYGFQPGVAVECKHDIKKSFFNTKQHGMVTVFTTAVKT